LRRIHAKQGRTPLGNLEQKQPTPNVAILEGLVAKGLLQLVELNQLQGQRTTQKLVAVKLNRMLVQGREPLRNRETMARSKGAHTLVDQVIHGASLGLSHRMTNYHIPSALRTCQPTFRKAGSRATPVAPGPGSETFTPEI